MRVMALDWGKRRIGVAISDELGIAAHGQRTLVRTTKREDIDALISLIRDRNIDTVIVGNPLHLNGAESGSSSQAARFAFQLGRHAGIPVEMWDERLTSWEAETILGTRQKDPGEIDRLAAVLLLESYLAAKQS
jgi:putative Holliday junction resolvase